MQGQLATSKDDRDDPEKTLDRPSPGLDDRVLSPAVLAALGNVNSSVRLTPGRTVRISGRRTSIRLSDEHWNALKQICAREARSIDAICSEIDQRRAAGGTLSGAVREFVTLYFRAAAEASDRDSGSHRKPSRRTARTGLSIVPGGNADPGNGDHD